jgi:DNA-directed RNA polymerase subunit H (RpoH/RPB5)
MSSQSISSIISYIFKSRVTLLELLTIQGYNTSDYLSSSINDVNSMYTNKQMDMLVEKIKPNDKGIKTKTYVRYYLGKILKQQNIQEMIDDLFNLEEILTKDDTLIIILKDDPNETLVTLLKQLWEEDGIFIIIFNLKRLQYNILNHSLVPPHRIMDDNEIDEIKKKYNINNNTEFAEISRFDAVSLAIGIRPGQVCEILRPSKTAIVAPYYRICV